MFGFRLGLYVRLGEADREALATRGLLPDLRKLAILIWQG